jgi:hypothetical protein
MNFEEGRPRDIISVHDARVGFCEPLLPDKLRGG